MRLAITFDKCYGSLEGEWLSLIFLSQSYAIISVTASPVKTI